MSSRTPLAAAMILLPSAMLAQKQPLRPNPVTPCCAITVVDQQTGS